VVEQNLVGKRPLGKPKLKWKDAVKRTIEALGSKPNWKIMVLEN